MVPERTIFQEYHRPPTMQKPLGILGSGKGIFPRKSPSADHAKTIRNTRFWSCRGDSEVGAGILKFCGSSEPSIPNGFCMVGGRWFSWKITISQNEVFLMVFDRLRASEIKQNFRNQAKLKNAVFLMGFAWSAEAFPCRRESTSAPSRNQVFLMVFGGRGSSEVLRQFWSSAPVQNQVFLMVFAWLAEGDFLGKSQSLRVEYS